MRAFRGLLLPCMVVLSVACGHPEPRFVHRTAAEWVSQLWSGSTDEVTQAADALIRFAKIDPDPVIAALERRLMAPPPRPAATPFTLAIDRDGGKRIGLSESTPGEAVQSVLTGLRIRVQELDLVPASIKGTGRQEIDLLIPGARQRPEAERVQALLATRAAIDIRLLVPDPAAAPAGAPASVYDGKEPFAAMKAAEIARYAAAKKAGTPYEQAGTPWRVVPRPGTTGASADDFWVVMEPTEPRDALDESMVREVQGVVSAAGVPTLELTVRPERVDDAKRLAKRDAGREWAVIVDGEAWARMAVPTTDGERLSVPLGPPAKGQDAATFAKEWAALVRGGRLPWPLKPVPISPSYFADPPAENPLSRVFAAIGPQAAPALRRLVASSDAPTWGKASAQWALDQLGP